MAYADYYLCDVCGSKAFYDSNLDYNFDHSVAYGCGSKLGYVGDMACICDACALTHEVKVVERAARLPGTNGSGVGDA